MGEVVHLSDYRHSHNQVPEQEQVNGLVPIEFAVGLADRGQCIAKAAEYGVRAVHIRLVNEDSGALIYLIGVVDAINLNKSILEHEELSEDEIEQRIDLIQMLENTNLPMMESMWNSFTCQSL